MSHVNKRQMRSCYIKKGVCIIRTYLGSHFSVCKVDGGWGEGEGG